MTILALDPGLTLAWALYRLEANSLTLARYGCERYPGKPHGNAGRESVTLWAAERLAPFAGVDEVCSDNELAGANLATNVPALGAFDACRVFGREHGRHVRGRRVFGEYARRSYVTDVGMLTGRFQRGERIFWKPKTAELREALSELTGFPLTDTKGGRHHILDAVAVGICHSHRAHGWRPADYRPPVRSKAGGTLLARVRAAREDATRK